jgi:hypothetical protein
MTSTNRIKTEKFWQSQNTVMRVERFGRHEIDTTTLVLGEGEA